MSNLRTYLNQLPAAVGASASDLIWISVSDGMGGYVDKKITVSDLDASLTSAVISVNGFTGVVELHTDDIPEEPSALYFTDARARAAITGGASTIVSSNLTVSKALVSDGSGKVAVSSTTATEIGYVAGVISGIQGQFTGKQDLNTRLTQIAGLSTPGNSQILFYNQSALSMAFLQIGAGLTISGTTLINTSSGGNVSNTGTPVANQVAIWTDAQTIKGVTGLTYDGSNLQITGDIGSTGTRITKGWFTDLQVTNAIAGSITGNAGTATALQNARTIGGISFNGTANITVSTATAGFTVSGGDLALGANNITLTGSIASSGSRSTKGWFTDLDVTNAIIGSATNIATATESTDTTCFLVFVTASGTQTLPAKTNTGLTYNSNTNNLGATTFTGALAGNATTATALATGRTIAITGDLTYTSPSFDGSGNVTAAGTLATVNANVGSFGSATQVAAFTVNGKGLTTAASNITITPAVGSITGLGTGVATALAVNIGSAGAFVTFNGALGTPSSGTLSSCTGLPVSTGISGLGTGVATWLATPSSANLISAVTDETGTGSLVFGTGPTITSLAGSILMGASIGTARFIGLQSQDNSTRGNNAGGAETDLATTTLNASAMAVNRNIRITAWGDTANNGNAKTLKMYFGTTVIFSRSMTTLAANNWSIVAIVNGTGTNTQQYSVQYIFDGTTVVGPSHGTATETVSSSVVIKMTGAATSSSDIRQFGMLVEYIN